MGEVIHNPMTIVEAQALLPGIGRRALAEEFRSRGLYVKGTQLMLITVDQVKRLIKATEIKKPQKRITEGRVNTEPGFVYFVACDLSDGTALVKIGYARNVATRLIGLQSANALPIRLIGAIPGSPEREKLIHLRFARVRQRGEWFALTPEMEQEFRELADG